MKTYLILASLILLSSCSKSKSGGAADFDELRRPNCPGHVNIDKSNGQPTVLVMGDSVSIGYTPKISSVFNQYQTVHNPCNAMTTRWTLSQLETWLSGRNSFEAIIFNNGLWDIADGNGISPEEYENNLRHIAAKIKDKTSRPLFVLTTMVLPIENGRKDSDAVSYNFIAKKVMDEKNIPVLDLYSMSKNMEQNYIDGVHFNQEGYNAIGQAIADELTRLYGL